VGKGASGKKAGTVLTIAEKGQNCLIKEGWHHFHNNGKMGKIVSKGRLVSSSQKLKNGQKQIRT
jgi:hypothetical protein